MQRPVRHLAQPYHDRHATEPPTFGMHWRVARSSLWGLLRQLQNQMKCKPVGGEDGDLET
ncbi:hypothetical protein DVT68_18185 [Dyella solisilvae]|uniref:Uncharacterized protein n=1 Tax=Dyella solisilvae TaxID=1920168 RepID=A0A370K3S2_9GAMM|nr:hypothetical protein DVT68_18185 [Dyella solisilvae]